MSNALANAGGLDGVLNWGVTSGQLYVDETTIGGPGRAAFVLPGSGSGSILSTTIIVSPGELIEAYGYSRGADQMHVDFLDGTGSQLLQVAPLPRIRPGAGAAAKRGLLFTYDFAYGRVVAPTNAGQARIVTGVSAVGGFQLALTKPYLAAAPSVGRPTVWDPGSHTNPDLQLPVWPSVLPPFQSDALPEPIANMVGYGSDTNIQYTRDYYSGLQHTFRGHVRCDYDMADQLAQFYDANRTGFFVVRPDTDQLCVANWLPDGAPKPTSVRGMYTIYEIGLRLAVT